MDALVILVYVAVIASSVFVIRGTVRTRRAAAGAPDSGVNDLVEAAFLAGGPGRVADTVISEMHTDGRLAVGRPGVVSVRQPVARNPVENALLTVLTHAPNGALDRLRRELMRTPEVQGIGDELARRGLMVHPGALRFWRKAARAQVIGCWLCVLLGILASFGQAAVDGVPVIFMIIPALFFGFVIGASCGRLAKGRLTPAGKLALDAFRRNTESAAGPWGGPHGPWSGASATMAGAAPVSVAVALGGASAIAADTVLRDQLLQARRVTGAGASPGDGSGSSGLSDFSGGSWCGGGSGSGCGGSSCGGSSCGGGGGGSGCGGGGGGSSCGGGGGCGGGS
ncbi:TIGR04222 domain-containing membrane protein [Streptomyces sp. NPDC021098]|uniref:TIGR04222 domain-containing membrane protein n=1 Tax=unclassified Streptomyces TaxID=2593676 RepID=UPI0037AE9CE1